MQNIFKNGFGGQSCFFTVFHNKEPTTMLFTTRSRKSGVLGAR